MDGVEYEFVLDEELTSQWWHEDEDGAWWILDWSHMAWWVYVKPQVVCGGDTGDDARWFYANNKWFSIREETPPTDIVPPFSVEFPCFHVEHALRA